MFTSTTTRQPRIAKLAAASAAIALLIAGCGASNSSSSASTSGVSQPAGTTVGASGSGTSGANDQAGGDVTLITHDSFVIDDAMLADFEKASGLTVTVLAQGDAGAMVNQLLLTASNPLGDAVFGIDNTFASKALDAGVLAPYTSPAADSGSAQYAIGDDRLSAVDYGDVCVNVDHSYFAAKGLPEPVTFEDLAKPEYRDMLVVESPATSSPGLAFLLGSIAHFGDDGWQAYWTQLKDNGVKVTGGWTDAYSVDFSGSSGKGARPLVVSYASSPPSEVPDGATAAPTGALLDTCFRQVEYAGVLQGAKNPTGAQQVVDFLLSPEFQASVPDAMYVYPVDTAAALPAAWQSFAPVATDPATLDPAAIAKNRDAWISAWSDLMEG
ncbi:MAG: thiamine ABC transporter substrate-binding protein [Nakamurella sp.]